MRVSCCEQAARTEYTQACVCFVLNLVGFAGLQHVHGPVHGGFDRRTFVFWGYSKNERARRVTNICATADRHRPRLRLEQVSLDKLQPFPGIDEFLRSDSGIVEDSINKL